MSVINIIAFSRKIPVKFTRFNRELQLLRNLKNIRCISTSTYTSQIRNDDIPIHIFDRNTKHLQRERAASATDVNLYDYLKDEIGYRLADRIFDIKRKFKLAADVGVV